MNIKDLENVAALQIRYTRAKDLLDDVLAAEGDTFEAFASVPGNTGGFGLRNHIEIRAVPRAVVLASAEAGLKVVVDQLAALGVTVS